MNPCRRHPVWPVRKLSASAPQKKGCIDQGRHCSHIKSFSIFIGMKAQANWGEGLACIHTVKHSYMQTLIPLYVHTYTRTHTYIHSFIHSQLSREFTKAESEPAIGTQSPLLVPIAVPPVPRARAQRQQRHNRLHSPSMQKETEQTGEQQSQVGRQHAWIKTACCKR